MSVKVEYKSICEVRETLESNVPASTTPLIIHNGFNRSERIEAPTVDSVVAYVYELSGSSLDIDLTALIGTNEIDVDAYGKMIQFIKMQAPDTNGNRITVSSNTTNGYQAMGNFTVGLEPGAEFLFSSNSLAPLIDYSSNIIRMTGHAGDELNVLFVFGSVDEYGAPV